MERTRAAVLARAGETPCPDRAGGFVQHAKKMGLPNDMDAECCTPRATAFDPPCGAGAFPFGPDRRQPTVQAQTVLTSRRPANFPTSRPVKAPTPTVRASVSTRIEQGPSWAPCDPDELLAGLRLSAGAVKVFRELHRLACTVAQVRAYAARPSTVTFHLPAVILAALTDYSERHLYRLADELRAAGLIDERGHVAQVGKLRRYDGTLWQVALCPDARPRLRWWDFQHDWRPGFDAEYHAEQGAFREVQAIMSEPLAFEDRQGRLLETAKAWAAASRTPKSPVEGGSDIRPAVSLRAVAHALPALLGLHPRRRHREVSRLAADLAHALREPGRHRQHCAAIYAALQAENEQRPGLRLLALQLERLAVDLAELAPWKKPGAVLAARLRPA